jgi:hypothetical protein
MRRLITTFALLAALAVSGAAQAAPQTSTKKDAAKPATAAKPAAAASHSVKGTVKSIDASSLVISRSGKSSDMTFTLNADTKRDGAPAVGSPVSVRYRTEGSTNVATAVTAQAAKPAKTQAKK